MIVPFVTLSSPPDRYKQPPLWPDTESMILAPVPTVVNPPYMARQPPKLSLLLLRISASVTVTAPERTAIAPPGSAEEASRMELPMQRVTLAWTDSIFMAPP